MSDDIFGTDIMCDENLQIVLGVNDFQTVKSTNCALQGVKRRLKTPLGSIFYDRSYGSKLHTFIQATKDNVLIRSFKKEVQTTLKKEPLVDNDSIIVNVYDHDDFSFYCEAGFNFLNHNNNQNLVIGIGQNIKIWSI